VRNFSRKPQRKTSLEDRRRWEDNIKTNVIKIGFECVKWIHLAQDIDQLYVLVNGIISIQVP
jgi:hypothetical protein